jgi:hypothetical protein
MGYDPSLPVNGSLISAPELRSQFQGLHDLITAIPAGPEGPPGPEGPAFGGAVVDIVNTLPAGSGAAADASMFGGIIHFTFSIPTGQTGADGAPGEVSTLQLNAAVNTCAQNPAGVPPLNIATATLADVIAKVNELLAALLRI